MHPAKDPLCWDTYWQASYDRLSNLAFSRETDDVIIHT